MTHLRKMMLEERERRNYSDKTIRYRLLTLFYCRVGKYTIIGDHAENNSGLKRFGKGCYRETQTALYVS